MFSVYLWLQTIRIQWQPAALRGVDRFVIHRFQGLPMTARTAVHRLQVASVLHRFIEDEVLPGTGIESSAFWQGFDAIVADLAPRNIALLAERDRLQAELDTWHQAHPGPITDMAAYRQFLETIGYLVPAPTGVQATTTSSPDWMAC